MKNAFITTLTTLTKINFNFSFYLFLQNWFLWKLFCKVEITLSFNISENCERKTSFQMQIRSSWAPAIKQTSHHTLFSLSTNQGAVVWKGAYFLLKFKKRKHIFSVGKKGANMLIEILIACHVCGRW